MKLDWCSIEWNYIDAQMEEISLIYLSLDEPLTLLTRRQTGKLDSPNSMPLPHKKHDEQEREHSKESHHAVNPAHIHSFNPGVDIECDGQPIDNAVRTDHNTRFGGILCEGLHDVVYSNRDTWKGPNSDQENRQR
jgi:hypothetical protein